MFITDFLGKIMHFLYIIFNNYGLAIIVFTLISKIILIPIAVWVHKNSIKMVKLQPEVNKVKIDYYGDKDKIADEESEIYKKYKYNPFASIIPLVIQIFLLLALVQIIYHPLTYLLNMNKNEVAPYQEVLFDNHKEINKESNSTEVLVVKDLKESHNYDKLDSKTNKNIKDLKLNFLGFDLTWIASQEKGIAFLVPIITALSSLVLCLFQNAFNVLQSTQSRFSKYGTLLFSVGLSGYLGMFVPSGVALYWTASNMFTIIQLFILNAVINPKKHVDYKELERTNEELQKLNNIKTKRTSAQKKKEKEDYKRFFSIINKHLVFYSESNGFYKYFKGIIEYLLENTNITIHYITSDYNDNIFEMEKEYDQIKAYYIEERKLITLMMKMDADIVVMTMPDLNNYHIKRSYVRKDIEYIYIPHAIHSLNLTMRYKSMDAYDTVFVSGQYQKEEALKTNEVHNIKNRKIFEWGYSLLDDMIEDYNTNKKDNKIKKVLIAPSWQKDNIIDLCLDDILNSLKNEKYEIIVRPHPQHVRHMKEFFNQMKEKYKDNKNIEIQTDFSSNDTVFNADIMITDWSSIAYEYAFATNKPVIFIDTPMKIMNEMYQELDIEPFNVWSREKIGEVVKVKDCKDINKTVKNVLKNNKEYNKKISALCKQSMYNIGNSSEVGAEYIIEQMQKRIKERSK